MEKALFDWPIVLQYDVKVKYRLISKKFSCMIFFHSKATLVCIRSINQSNRSISVRLLFLFCWRVFIIISRSYENRSNIPSSLKRYFLLQEVTPFYTVMKFISIPLCKRLQCITFTKPVFLKIFMGVPVNLSFLTSCTDLSKSNTLPVAAIRKSAYV